MPGYTPENIPEGATYSVFTPPAVTGLGFLQYVTDADILALADPEDLDGDGISGVPNWDYIRDFTIPSADAIIRNGKYIHRFGKKASVYDLLEQTVDAYNQDMGITSIFDPKDTYSGLAIDPEVSKQTIRDVVFYLETLKAPIPRNQKDPQVQFGKNIFTQIQCASCHMPKMKTGYAPIEALSFKTFHPYTDLLLHDMGPALAEGRAVATALSSLAQQPDASATITRTLFVGLAMVESTAIYCFVVSMILIFANPFWNHVIAQATGK